MAEQRTSTDLSDIPTLPVPAVPAEATIVTTPPPFEGDEPAERLTAGQAERLLAFARSRFSLFKRLVSFLVVGGLGAVMNIVIFTLAYSRFEAAIKPQIAAYLIAFLLATEISLLFNFALNDQVTFRHLRSQKRSWQVRCARFHVTSIGGTLLTLGISFTLLNIVHLKALFAQAIALIIATVFNFAFHHLFTYRHTHEETNGAISVARTERSEPAVESALERGEISAMETIPAGLPAFSAPLASTPFNALIIIPTYNELENLPRLLATISSYASDVDILVVDDNSPDGTGALAEQLGQQNRHIHVLHRAGKLGLGTAYIAGFQYAIAQGYDAAFEMDADFSHDPRFLPAMLQAIEHADLVIGSRYIPGGGTPTWSLKRRIISGGGNLFARYMLGIPVHDCTGGFRCYRRRVLENINLETVQSRGYAFQVELTYRVMQAGFKITEVPIIFMDRQHGVSKMSGDIVVEAFKYVLRERFARRASTSL